MTQKDNDDNFDELEHAQYEHFLKLFCKKFEHDLYTTTGIKGGYVFIFSRGPTVQETDVFSNLNVNSKIRSVCNAQELIQLERLKDNVNEMKDKEGDDQYPDGKITDTDEGVATMAVGVLNDLVEVNFLKPTAWIALPPDEAVSFGLALIQSASKIGITKPITIEL